MSRRSRAVLLVTTAGLTISLAAASFVTLAGRAQDFRATPPDHVARRGEYAT
jgi:hypothetical protein